MCRKLLVFCVATLALIFNSAGKAEIEIVDLAGRFVTLPKPAKTFVISEGRYLSTLAILRPENPVEGLVGMMSSLGWTHPRLQEQLYKSHPQAKDIALFGSREANSVSVEKIIDLSPDLAIFGIQDHGPNAKQRELIDLLTASGTKVVFIDFRMDPMRNTERSIEIMGQVLGADARAQDYLNFYRARKQSIITRAAAIEQRPSVFLQAHPGRMPCCWGMADGMLGPLVELVGGQNIANKVAPGPTSHHTAEFLLVEDPDVWIGTASGTLEEFNQGKSPLALGPGITPEMARESLQEIMGSTEFQVLSAVRNNRAHSIWHNFYNSPMNIVAIEAFASWIHPDQFSDLNPEGTLKTIYQRFLPFKLEGTYTATIDTP
ncbi:MAG: ABC transporter substrate-binding protein [Pseudomonadota bacterium]